MNEERKWGIHICCCCSVAKCNSLWPHELQHTTPHYPPLSPRVSSNSCPLSWWGYLTISSFAIPFSFCLKSVPGTFSKELALCIRRPKYWSFSFSVSPSNENSGLISFRIDWFDFLVSKVFSITTIWKHQFFSAQPSFLSNSHTWRLLEKPYLWLCKPLSARWYICSLIHSLGLS